MNLSSSRKADVVIADTGPLLAIARIQCLPLLRQLLGNCLLTETVYRETQQKPVREDAKAIADAVNMGSLTVISDQKVRSSLSSLDR